MTRCSMSRRVFDLASAGEILPPRLGAHAATCPACQSALAAASEFEQRLVRAAGMLAEPTMPDIRSATLGGEQRRRPAVASAALATAAVALAVLMVSLAVPLLDRDGGGHSNASFTTTPSQSPAGSKAPPPTGVASLTPTDSSRPSPRAMRATIADLYEAEQGGETAATYGSADILVQAYLWPTGAIDPCQQLDPNWLHVCEGRGIMLRPPEQAQSSGSGMDLEPPFVFAVLHPDVGELPDEFVAGETAVSITAHYDDQAAAACHYPSWDPSGGPTPAPESVVEMCRWTLVITRVEPINS